MSGIIFTPLLDNLENIYLCGEYIPLYTVHRLLQIDSRCIFKLLRIQRHLWLHNTTQHNEHVFRTLKHCTCSSQIRSCRGKTAARFYHYPLPTIANYCSLPWFSFGQGLGKLQGRVLTHPEKVGWWKNFDGGMCKHFLAI